MKWETMNWRKKQEKTKRWKHQNRDKEFGPWPKVNKKFGNDEMKKTTIKLNNGKALRGITKLETNLSNSRRSKRGTMNWEWNKTNNWCGNDKMGCRCRLKIVHGNHWRQGALFWKGRIDKNRLTINDQRDSVVDHIIDQDEHVVQITNRVWMVWTRE